MGARNRKPDLARKLRGGGVVAGRNRRPLSLAPLHGAGVEVDPPVVVHAPFSSRPKRQGTEMSGPARGAAAGVAASL